MAPIRIAVTFNKHAAMIKKVEAGFRYFINMKGGEESEREFALWQAIHDPAKQNSSYGDMTDTAFFNREDLAVSFLTTSTQTSLQRMVLITDGPPSGKADERIYDLVILKSADRAAAKPLLS